MDLNVRNKIVVALTQALLGAISSNFKVIMIDFSLGVDVSFFLEEESVEDFEEIEDVITEFDALLMGIEAVQMTYSVVVGKRKVDFSSGSVIPVYIKRGWDSQEASSL